MNRRTALTSTSLIALTLASCSAITGTTTPSAAVQAVLNEIQFLLPLIDALALGISVAVPGSAAAMAAIAAALNQAGPIFQTLQATMTIAQAQPIVQQIETYVTSAVAAIAKTVNANAALAAYQAQVAQAQQVVGLLVEFVNGVTAAPAARAIALPPLLHR